MKYNAIAFYDIRKMDFEKLEGLYKQLGINCPKTPEQLRQECVNHLSSATFHNITKKQALEITDFVLDYEGSKVDLY